MGAEHSRRLTPIGLSVLVNLALIGLMARALVTAPAEGQRYIAVELRTAPTFNVQRSPAFSGIPPKAGNAQRTKSVQRSSFRVQRSVPDVRRSTFEVTRSPFTVHRSPSLPMPGPIDVAGSLQNFTGAGTSATGPGAYVGVGPGGGTSGPGESTISVPQAGTTPNVQLPTSNFQLPTPSPPPKGESRSPSVARQTKPVYPQDAREEGVEGVSIVLAYIDPEGKVTVTKLQKSSGDRRLDRAALDAVSHWTYNPCLRDDVPVKSSVRVTVQFRLE